MSRSSISRKPSRKPASEFVSRASCQTRLVQLGLTLSAAATAGPNCWFLIVRSLPVESAAVLLVGLLAPARVVPERSAEQVAGSSSCPSVRFVVVVVM